MSIASASLFDLSRAQSPIRGRALLGPMKSRPDNRAGDRHQAMTLATPVWRRSESLVGKTISLDGQSYTVIGIAPPGFDYPWKTAVWISPLRLVPEARPGVMDTTRLRGIRLFFSTRSPRSQAGRDDRGGAGRYG